MNTNEIKYDDFNDLLNDNIEKDEKRPFSISQIKLTHYHWNSGEVDLGSPIKTSIELSSEYDFEKNKLVWTRTVTHIYHSINGRKEPSINTFSEEIEANNLISKINEIDLRKLKNNYYTETMPERFTHWEIRYNNYFKIVGTYDQELSSYKKLCNILEFEQIINQELDKVESKIKNKE